MSQRAKIDRHHNTPIERRSRAQLRQELSASQVYDPTQDATHQAERLQDDLDRSAPRDQIS